MGIEGAYISAKELIFENRMAIQKKIEQIREISSEIAFEEQ